MVMLLLRAGGIGSDPSLTIRQSPQGESMPRGFYFGKGGFTGWDDGSTMRSETLPRPQAHGDFDVPGFLAGRLVSMSGWCLAESQYELEQYRDRFIGLGAGGTKFRAVVERNGRTLWADGRLAAGSSPTFEDTGGAKRRARWQTSWWFPDPRKYGAPFSETAVSSVSVRHEGNFGALPKLTVSGTAASGYYLTGPGGRQIVVTRPLVPGSPHTFDMASARLSVGGVPVLGGVSKAELFTLPAWSVTTVTVSFGLSLTVSGDATFI